jgi:DNA topoisomerase-1
MNVVVVESPAKAKTINKYLGSSYVVLASYGHVRDLPSKDGSVLPDRDFEMLWEIDGDGAKRVNEIARTLKEHARSGPTRLILATDPDREGEAISWHVLEILKDKGAIKNVDVERVVFNEITKNAILDAMKKPRELHGELVDAYLARRALDYLVGFTLSPVLWRKLPGARSAGRVQSVALRLICDRELDIEKFRAREYWTIEAIFRTPDGKLVTSRLTHLGGKKLTQFDLASEADAKAALAEISAREFAVAEVESKPTKRHPAPPFTTSTLQQEAARKLGFAASRTMSIAQRLYEGVDVGGETVGLITYMRTDGVQMAGEAIAGARRSIERDHGARYLPPSPRQYTSKAKNAQEAHEAIRPTDFGRRPKDLARMLDPDQLRLYELIWKRALASQMASAELERTTVDIASPDGKVMFRATGTVVLFDGFLTLYQEGRDDAPVDDEEGASLPKVAKGAPMARDKVTPSQHFTEPPPRFSEASLVKRLEELGIGRPSTYASILQVLRDRAYVRMDKNRFVPEDKGRLVTAFLESFFSRYVDYNFTANLEEQLDEISAGKIDWKAVLRDFWRDFSSAVDGTKELRVAQVLDALDELLGPHIFPETGNGTDPRVCPSCGAGRLGLRLGKFGAFVGCSNYPECRYTRQFAVGDGENGGEAQQDRVLGIDPETGLPVSLKKGRFGPYLQLGEGEKPKRASIPRDIPLETVDLALALKLLALPRVIGAHPETSEEISAGIGRYGPYILHQKRYVSLPTSSEAFEIGLNRAVALLAEPPRRRGQSSPAPLRVVGTHPGDAAPINLMKGRFGNYLAHGGVNATLPRDLAPEDVTVEQAVELLAARAAKGKPTKAKRGAAKAPAKKAAPKAEKAPAKAPAKAKASSKTKSPAKAKPASKPKAGAKRAAG